MPLSYPRHRPPEAAGSARVMLALLVSLALGIARPSLVAAQATCSSTESLACGEIKAGTISALAQTDCFQFAGEAGEVVTLLSKSAGSSIQACSQLRGPGGDIIGTDACEQPATITLPATGTYTIRLFDRSNDETGGYNVQLQVLSATASSCPTATLPCGATPAGILASIVESDTYRFVAAQAGEVVSITASDTSAPFEACWQLYAADGSPIGTLECAQDTRTLPAPGPYTIRVFELGNDATGTYRLDVTVLSATTAGCPDATLSCGETHTGSIAALADNDVYWFTTTSVNQVVDITTTTTAGTMNTCWELFDANGASTGGGIICGHDERVVATPGTYVLRVFDLTYEGSGTYEVSAQTLPVCLVTPTPTATPTPTPTPPVTVTVTSMPSDEPTPASSGSGATATPVESTSPGGTVTPGDAPTPTGSPGGGGTTTPTSGSPFDTPTPLRTPSIQSLEAVLDDFLCYATTRSRGGPVFTPARGVQLDDAFESMRFDVRKPARLCAPADKDGDGIGDPSTNLERYRLQRVAGAPRYVRTTRRVATALGTLSLDTSRPDQLLVPTAGSAVTPPPAPDSASHLVDYYKCYQVRVTRKTPKLPFDLQVVVSDQLSSGPRRLKVKSPTRLCVATDKNPEGIKNPAGHLLCYPTRPIRGEPKHVKQRGLYLENTLGATRVDTVREAELCLPAILLP